MSLELMVYLMGIIENINIFFGFLMFLIVFSMAFSANVFFDTYDDEIKKTSKKYLKILACILIVLSLCLSFMPSKATLEKIFVINTVKNNKAIMTVIDYSSDYIIKTFKVEDVK